MLESFFNSGSISKSQAMEIPAVAACVKFISEKVACLPIKLYEEGEAGVKEVKDDIRVFMLNDECGDTLNAYQMKRAVVQDYLLDGGGYIYIEKDRNFIESLRYVKSESVSTVANADPIYKTYDILVNGQTFMPYDFFKILRNTKDGAKGVGIISEQSLPLSLMYATLKFERNLLKTGGGKKGFLQSTKRLTEEAMKELKKAWTELYSENTNNMLILNDGLTFQEGAESSVSMQLNENKKLNGEDICKMFGLSISVISGTATEQQTAAAIQSAVVPIIKEWESSLDRDLLLESEKGKMYFAFDTKELLKGDILRRFNAYKLALDANFMQLDEVRYLEDLEPLDFNYIKLGLQDVLMNPKTKDIYVPNTNANINLEKGETDENRNKGGQEVIDD